MDFALIESYKVEISFGEMEACGASFYDDSSGNSSSSSSSSSSRAAIIVMIIIMVMMILVEKLQLFKKIDCNAFSGLGFVMLGPFHCA